MQIGLAKKRVFGSPEFLTLAHGFSFVAFSRAFSFSFVFYSPPFWSPFSYSNYVTLKLQYFHNFICFAPWFKRNFKIYLARLSCNFISKWAGHHLHIC